MNNIGQLREYLVCFCIILSANFLRAQSCETFDGFTNCGNNAFSCVPDDSCASAITSTGWQNATGDDIDWSVSDGPTPSDFTGPDADHTTGNGKYLFTEASSCFTKKAILLSPVYDLSAISSPVLQFWYHMFGVDMGSLTVDVQITGSAGWTPLWMESGDHGPNWNLATVSLSAYAGDSVRFRFVGVTGIGYASDMGLDDICAASACLLTCNDSDPCTFDYCFDGNCLFQQINCDDADMCTNDHCDNGVCVNDSMDCSDTDPCTLDYCSFGDCYIDPPCDDFDDCTIDSCDGVACHHTPIACDDGLPAPLTPAMEPIVITPRLTAPIIFHAQRIAAPAELASILSSVMIISPAPMINAPREDAFLPRHRSVCAASPMIPLVRWLLQ